MQVSQNVSREELVNPDVSFIVLCYNFSQYIGECIESILAQTRDWNYEIIVIDDASQDGSDRIIQSYERENLVVRYHLKNVGHVESLNEAVSLARGRYIARIDGDDRYREDFLLRAMQVFRDYPQVSITYGDVALIDENGGLISAKADMFNDDHDLSAQSPFLRLLEHNFIPAPTLIAKNEVFRSAFPIPSDLHFTDWYINLVLVQHGYIHKMDGVVADYRLHSQNLHRNFDSGKYEHSVMWILDEMFIRFGQTPGLFAVKEKIYSQAYTNIANKYFAAGNRIDARRCYVKALQWQSRLLLNRTFNRRFVSAMLSDRQYQFLKTRRDWLKKKFA